MRRLLPAVGLLVLLLSAAPAAAAPTLTRLGFFDRPMYVTAQAGDPDRVFVVQQAGIVTVLKDGTPLPDPFLDISADVALRAGFTSMAFAPDYATSGKLYVLYDAPHPPTDPPNGIDVVLDEFTRSATDPDRVDPASRREVMRLDFDGTYDHDADHVAFGPDGLLYMTVGDGQTGFNLAQDPSAPRGKVLRIDPRPDGAEPYRIPPGNPFADGVGGMPEVFAYGLRNPWRFAFDPAARELLIGDVGDGAREELDALDIDAGGGENLGWPCREGTQEHNTDGPCTAPPPASVPPVFEYGHGGPTGRCAITGGYVVRDPNLPTLTGKYVYGDFCSGEVRTLRRGFGNVDAPSGVTVPGGGLSSFGEDGCGHLYAVDYLGSKVYRVDDGAFVPCPRPPAPPADEPPPAPPAPPANPAPLAPDKTAPLLHLSGTTVQRALHKRRLLVGARCNEACELSATGELRRPSGGSAGRTEREAAGRKRVTLKLRLKASAARALRALLDAGGRGLVRIHVVARDGTGNRSVATRYIAVVR